ncbi:S1 family peptidase [Mucilaginibacter paludis]|uniref:Serine protease n=1 Tax=Mucilaginibacter paludis DSM 18603 TaxID=714943 RepID=H1YBZ0_9SPHI|nr:serine protease [Mucilaginibacter paludis]EHQ27068.1 hypothetical protein Mucpa_2960 [Mucilaginibacter paludis DSM 18603]
MKYLFVLILFFSNIPLNAQNIKDKERIVEKWTKATVNVLCYSKLQRDWLLSLDSVFSAGKIDSVSYQNYIYQLIALGSTGTAIWLTYQNHNFLLTARHVLEDVSISKGSCFSEIHIIENDTIHSIDRSKFEPRPHRTFAAEVGTPSDKLFVNNTKLFKFSPVDDDMAVVNIDSSYYAYGLFKFLRLSGFQPVGIEDIDTLFKVKNGDPVFAIGYPNESVTKRKNTKELPTSYALATSPIYTIPIITNGVISDINNGKNTFEIDVFTYHGFSGGPIINKKGKLIGITHGASTPRKSNSKGNYLEYHGEFKKSTLLIPLLHDVITQVQSQQMQARSF